MEWNAGPECKTDSPKLRGTGDFNGDGVADLLLQRCVLFANPGPRAEAHRLTAHKQGILGQNIKEPWKVYVGELNGDGRADVIVERTGEFCDARQVTLETYTYEKTENNTVAVFAKKETINATPGTRVVGFADFNGDGLSDLLFGYSSEKETWCQDKAKFIQFHLRPSKGDGTLADWSDTTKTETTPLRVRGIGDYDGDGRGDFHVGDKLYAFDGEVFAERPAIPLSEQQDIKVVGDMNGDGMPDFLVAPVDANGLIAANAQMLPFKSIVGHPDEITSIVNGLGSATHIKYGRLTQGDVYTKGEGAAYPQRDFFGPLAVVSEVSSDTGIDVSSGTAKVPQFHPISYQYGKALIDVSQQRFLGFKTMTTTDALRGMSIAETFAQGFPCMGMLKRKEVLVGEQIVKTEAHDPAYWTKGGKSTGGEGLDAPAACIDLPSGGLTYAPFARSVTAERWELGQETPWDTQTVRTEIDRYGNVRVKETTFDDGSTERVDTEYEYSDDYLGPPQAWIPGRTKNTTTVSTKGADQHQRSVRYDYLNGRVQFETRDEGTDKEIVAEYSYDVFGNITTKALGGRPEAAYTFDSRGRYPVCTINAAGHLETREYSPLFGAETRVVDANTLAHNNITACPTEAVSDLFPSTEIEYDVFGRKTKELLPSLDANQRPEKGYVTLPDSGSGIAYRTEIVATGAPHASSLLRSPCSGKTCPDRTASRHRNCRSRDSRSKAMECNRHRV